MLTRIVFLPALALALAGCFLSHPLEGECAEDEPRPVCAGSVEVESCAGWDNCFSTEWCGQTIRCASNGACDIVLRCAAGDEGSAIPCGPGETGCSVQADGCGGVLYCRGACDEPRPICADSIEVESCEGWDSCFTSEWCGETIRCANNTTCGAPPPVCAPDEVLVTAPCAPDQPGCRPITGGCGEAFSCQQPVDCLDPIFEPCSDATSLVLSNGPGECPDFDSGGTCHTTDYCGSLHWCETACYQGGVQLDGPWQCDDPNDCYSMDAGRDDLPLFWCQGNGPACRAIPTCDGAEEIPLNSPCPDGAYCEYRSTCSTTIQCAFFPVPG